VIIGAIMLYQLTSGDELAECESLLNSGHFPIITQLCENGQSLSTARKPDLTIYHIYCILLHVG